jgi:cysteine desulfurase/selenocysteine lyase
MNPNMVLAQYGSVVEKIRRDFPLLQRIIGSRRIIYLDNAATTQKPSIVLKKEEEFYTFYNANVHRGIYRLAMESTEKYESARRAIASFLHADKEEIVFTSGTTAGINIVARAIENTIEEGDEIIVTILEHHSNFVPWQQLSLRKKAKLVVVPLENNLNRIDLAYLSQMISSKTKVIAFSYASNVLGVINPVEEIIALAQKVGALTVIDAAQAISYVPINVTELNCDFLVFSGHKIMGPTGIGVLFGKKKHLTTLEPVFYGGEMVKEVAVAKTSWNDLPWKWEAGTPNIAGAIGLGLAFEYHQSLITQEVRSYLASLKEYAILKLQSLSGIKIVSSLDKLSIPIITFTLQGVHPHDVAEILNRENIFIRAGHHCTMPLHRALNIHATCRISLYYYNTKEEIDLFVLALLKVQEVFS